MRKRLVGVPYSGNAARRWNGETVPGSVSGRFNVLFAKRYSPCDWCSQKWSNNHETMEVK